MFSKVNFDSFSSTISLSLLSSFCFDSCSEGGYVPKEVENKQCPIPSPKTLPPKEMGTDTKPLDKPPTPEKISVLILLRPTSSKIRIEADGTKPLGKPPDTLTTRLPVRVTPESIVIAPILL